MIGRNGRETFFSRFFLATTAIMNSFGLTLDWHVNRIRGHPFFLIVRCQATGFFFSTFFLIWLLFLLSKPNSIRVDSILNSNKKNIVMQLNPTSGFGLFFHFFFCPFLLPQPISNVLWKWQCKYHNVGSYFTEMIRNYCKQF